MRFAALLTAGSLFIIGVPALLVRLDVFRAEWLRVVPAALVLYVAVVISLVLARRRRQRTTHGAAE